ncbi:MAG: hypothetical protein NTX17_07950 [Candidatus Eisenbacteria bacterium]|nr:hypothetical protein [Candidatus Eisenbacteria bacterium]
MRPLALMCFVCRIWVLVIVLVPMLAGCGDDDTVKPSGGTNGSLVFTRENGSVVEFSAAAETFVWCGPWETDLVPVPSLHVWFGSLEQPEGWVLRAVVRDIEIGDTLRFPNYFVWDQPDSVHLFLLDLPNELATDTEESGGFIVFHHLPCSGGMIVDFSIDAVMGSEYWDMPPVTVRGRFTARVTGPLPAGAQPPGLGGLHRTKHGPIVSRR